MTPNQITQLRQLLFEIFAIADNDEPLPVEGEPLCSFPRIKNLAEQALALLPCETCNGTRFVQAECEACAIGVSHSPSECGGGKPCPDCQPCKRCEEAHTTSCPDCQPRTCVCCEEITEENAHLHRNCGK